MKKAVVLSLPIAAALGSLLPGIGSVFGFRLLVLLLSTIVVTGAYFSPQPVARTTATKTLRLLSLVWVISGVLLSFFVDDFQAALREMTAITFGLLLLNVFTLTEPQSTLRQIRLGWILSYCVTGLVAAWEFVTLSHLSNYLPSTDLTNVDMRLLASVFGNPNAYAAYLTMAFPLMIYGAIRSQSRFGRYLHACLASTVPLVMLATGSRLCLFALAVQALIFLSAAGKQFRRSVFALVAASSLILIFSTGTTSKLASDLPGKLASAQPAQILQELVGGGSSTSGARRVNLYLDGGWMVADTAGVGVGPGNFESRMDSGRAPYDSGGVSNPHNLYMEIVAQYGIVVFLLFVAWITSALKSTRRTWKMQGAAGSLSMTTLAALAGGAISALANSSYLDGSINWVFFGTLVLMVQNLDMTRDALRSNPHPQMAESS